MFSLANLTSPLRKGELEASLKKMRDAGGRCGLGWERTRQPHGLRGTSHTCPHVYKDLDLLLMVDDVEVGPAPVAVPSGSGDEEDEDEGI